jgi:hypothetical protein
MGGAGAGAGAGACWGLAWGSERAAKGQGRVRHARPSQQWRQPCTRRASSPPQLGPGPVAPLPDRAPSRPRESIHSSAAPTAASKLWLTPLSPLTATPAASNHARQPLCVGGSAALPVVTAASAPGMGSWVNGRARPATGAGVEKWAAQQRNGAWLRVREPPLPERAPRCHSSLAAARAAPAARPAPHLAAAARRAGHEQLIAHEGEPARRRL